MFAKYIAGQYRRPTGLVGRWIGQKMVEQHRPENLWTVDLLDVQPADHILEIGFGGGFAIEQVAQHLTYGQISGVDFSGTMVHTASRRNQRAINAGRVNLRQGDAAKLPFQEATFDKVFSINCLYFWTEPLAALQGIYRVLKPGGMLVITLLLTERWPGEIPTPTPTFRAYSGAELRDLVSRAGFINTRLETDPNLENRSSGSVIGYKAT
jgi:ubiquinone/menaquinone biosynthesis C-methylase UbiE